MSTLFRGATSAVCSIFALIAAGTGPVQAQAAKEKVSVYTTRDKQVIEPMLRLFEGLTRVNLEITYLTENAIDKLRTAAAEGKVDVFIAAELSELAAAKGLGITEPVENKDLADRIPEIYRDPEGHWFGLTRRPRVVAASRERVKQKEFTYEELADPKWKGKVCMRSGLHAYNVTLVAALIAHKGAEFAANWLKGVKANLASKPSGGDGDQIAGVASGKCDLALVHTNYVGAMRTAKDRPEMQADGNAVNIMFPSSAELGTHASTSGMALMKDAPAINNAGLLMDFLTSEPAQFVYAQDNHEYPVREGVKLSGLVGSWGKPKLDTIPLADIVKLQPQAVDLIKKAGFDAGPGS